VLLRKLSRYEHAVHRHHVRHVDRRRRCSSRFVRPRFARNAHFDIFCRFPPGIARGLSAGECRKMSGITNDAVCSFRARRPMKYIESVSPPTRSLCCTTKQLLTCSRQIAIFFSFNFVRCQRFSILAELQLNICSNHRCRCAWTNHPPCAAALFGLLQ
jgi:hypothetical protein